MDAAIERHPTECDEWEPSADYMICHFSYQYGTAMSDNGCYI